MGEGAGILVLEEESKARERGAGSWAIRGYGATSDAHHLPLPSRTARAPPAQWSVRSRTPASVRTT